MKFLNPKEEVYTIKLTPHGRRLLMLGQFNPEYYAFYDNDIIYDLGYLSGSENSNELQNNITPRILDETPRFEGQTSFDACETTLFIGPGAHPTDPYDQIFPEIGEKLSDPSYNISKNQPWFTQKDYFLQNPLGNSDSNTQEAPYFKAQMITGSIITAGIRGYGASGYFGGKQDTPTAFVNQLELSHSNEITINTELLADDSFIAPIDGAHSDELFDSYYKFQDGTSMSYDKKKIFIKLEEGNTKFLKENFDIEIYKVTEYTNEAGKPQEVLEKLKIADPNNPVDVAIARDDSNYVEYYFNITVDNNIDKQYYCEAIGPSNKTEDIFSDNTFRCPEKEVERHNLNIYNTDKITESGDKC